MIIVAVLSLLFGISLAQGGTGARPNVILVLLDDVSAREFSCYGGQGIHTPTMDAMAREGIMFRTAWCTPLCGPSRVLLHTGRYASRTGYYDNNISPRNPFWNRHQVMGKVMQSAGYATAMYGKSHFSNHPQANLGFDDYAILRHWPGYDGPPQSPPLANTMSMYAVQWYWHPGFLANGKGLPTRADDFGPDIETDLICNFIVRNQDKPFFIYYPPNLPHMEFHGTNVPTAPDAKWRYTSVPERDAQGKKTGKRIPGSLKADLEYMDYLIGRIWHQVKTAGLEQKTIIMITGDNGTAGYGKGSLHSEIALRVPFIVYGPGWVRKTGASDELIEFADVLPTLAELGGAVLPLHYETDGKSFAALLQGKPYRGREWIHSYLGTARWLRDRQWLLDGNGRLWFCGEQRDETKGYQDMSESALPEAVAAKKRLTGILNTLPAPNLDDPEVGPGLRRFKEAQEKKKGTKKLPATPGKNILPGARPLVGAIRWDAWHVPWSTVRSGWPDGPVKAVELSLSPGQYHYRLPFFARITADRQARIDGYTQAIVDQEITFARAGGLDYWAFLLYETNSPMSQGLDLYLSSQQRNEIRFCAIAGPGILGGLKAFGQGVERLVKLMVEPGYVKVAGGRPLLFLFRIDDKWLEAWGGPESAGTLFQSLRAAAQRAGLGDPYLVAMNDSAAQGAKIAKVIGAEAVSGYAVSNGGGKNGTPFAKLAQVARGYWEKCADTGLQVIPLVMAGWDRRPRVEHPVPWEKNQKPGVGLDRYYQMPTPVELAAHVEEAIKWTAERQTVCPAQAVLVYAWNEHDEGGWLCPTLKPDGTANPERLDALAKLMQAWKENAKQANDPKNE